MLSLQLLTALGGKIDEYKLAHDSAPSVRPPVPPAVAVVLIEATLTSVDGRANYNGMGERERERERKRRGGRGNACERDQVR